MLNVKFFFLKKRWAERKIVVNLWVPGHNWKWLKIDFFWASPPGEASLLAKVKTLLRISTNEDNFGTTQESASKTIILFFSKKSNNIVRYEHLTLDS